MKSSVRYSGSSVSSYGGFGRYNLGGGGSKSSMSFSSGLGMGMGLGMGSARSSVGGLVGGSSSGMSSSGLSMSSGLAGNEKQTMISLNNRLAEYLQKVKDLETANNTLELQLKEFHVGKTITGIDYSTYDAVIKPLREQILALHLGNARLALDLDNATLAAKDFKNKFENELYLRQTVEADIADLKALKDEYIRNYKDLESEIAASNDELAYLRKNHAEELALLKQQMVGTISVDVDAGPSVDLSKQLQKMRDEYEAYCRKNQEELDNWYKVQIESQAKQTVQVNEAVQNTKLQVEELRKQLQPLEIEFNSLLSGNASLEACIQEINDKYQQKLLNLQMSISQMEDDLTAIMNDMRQKVKDYEQLLCIKMKLESEIATYKKLLDGSAVGIGQSSSDTKETSGVITTIKTETRTIKSSY